LLFNAAPISDKTNKHNLGVGLDIILALCTWYVQIIFN